MKLIIKASYGLTALAEIITSGIYLWIGRYRDCSYSCCSVVDCFLYHELHCGINKVKQTKCHGLKM